MCCTLIHLVALVLVPINSWIVVPVVCNESLVRSYVRLFRFFHYLVVIGNSWLSQITIHNINRSILRSVCGVVCGRAVSIVPMNSAIQNLYIVILQSGKWNLRARWAIWVLQNLSLIGIHTQTFNIYGGECMSDTVILCYQWFRYREQTTKNPRLVKRHSCVNIFHHRCLCLSSMTLKESKKKKKQESLCWY